MENIQYNSVYYLELSVFDVNTNNWSPTTVSSLFNMTFDLQLYLNDSIDLTTANIYWRYNQNDYKLSKLNITILRLNGTNEALQEFKISNEIVNTCKYLLIYVLYCF